VSEPEPGKEHWRRALGLVPLPPFVWEAGRVGGLRNLGAIRSAIHGGLVFSAAALVLDLILVWSLAAPRGLVLVLAHLVWISSFFTLILLNTGFLEDLEGRPLERLGAANVLTLARVCLVPAAGYLILVRAWLPALIAYSVLGVTDVADGWVARRTGGESKLGFVLDPLGDVLLHLAILLALAFVGALPSWVAILVSIRYLLLLGGCLLLYAFKGEIWIQPTVFGKATGLLISFLTAFLLLTGAAGSEAELRPWIGRLLGWIFAAGVVHALLIGWNNFRRPKQGRGVGYRRGWGLLLGGRGPAPGNRRKSNGV
jgi:cardiolipin synthase